jgi:nucleoside-diphosphate-sugar epimerase
MSKCLVIGGTTFVGAALTRRLVALGYDVHVVVSAHADIWRIADIMLSTSVYTVDFVRNPNELRSIIGLLKPEAIVNCLSYGEYAHENDFDQMYEINFYLLVIILKSIREFGTNVFINTSSCEEYSSQLEPVSESIPTLPTSNFGVSKAAATMYVHKVMRRIGVPMYTIRPFVPYGPYQESCLFLTKLFASISSYDVTFKLYGRQQAYDFIYIDDLIDLYVGVLQKRPQDYYILNAGTGIFSTLEEQVEAFEAAYQHDVIVDWCQYDTYASGARTMRCSNTLLHNRREGRRADITRARMALGWKPRYNLKMGVESTFKWFMKNQNMYDQLYTKNENVVPLST